MIDWLPFTFGGAILLSGSVLATWFFGFQRTDLVLIILGAVGIAVSVLGCTLSLLGGIWVQWKYRQCSLHTGTFQVRNNHRVEHPIHLPWWIPLVQASWQWHHSKCQIEIDGKTEIVTPLRRGHLSQIQRKISVRDAFGICEVRVWSVQPAQIRILPRNSIALLPKIHHGLQSGADIANPFGKASGDRIDIRNYAQGDPVRFILWKVYARTGQLVVRTPEKAVEPIQRLVSYLVVGPSDSVAASVASEVLNSNLLGENWVFGLDGSSEDYTDVKPALDSIIRSGDSVINNGDGLQEFVLRHPDASSLMVFAPATVGSWIAVVQEVAEQIPVQVCLAGVLPSRTSTLEKILFTPEKNNDLAVLNPQIVSQISQILESSGVRVSILCPEWEAVLSPKDFQHRWQRVA